MRSLLAFLALAFVALAPRSALAQPEPPLAVVPPEPTPSDPSPPDPSPPDPAPPDPTPAPPAIEPSPPTVLASLPEIVPPATEPKPRMSEGRQLVSLYNSGFQWGISPGVILARGKAGFALGLRFGYGFDTGPVIVVPGVRLSGYFIDPNVYLGMPTVKLVLPIDRFAPFIEAGTGVGHVAEPSKTGLALMGGGGFMIYFTRVAFGVEASYQVITGTNFKGFGIGPILALGF